jgi:hypothetical protein
VAKGCCARGFGFLHGSEQRDAAFFVIIQPDAEVYFLRTLIGMKGFYQGQDGVAG